jgi:hypothetical protein
VFDAEGAELESNGAGCSGDDNLQGSVGFRSLGFPIQPASELGASFERPTEVRTPLRSGDDDD